MKHYDVYYSNTGPLNWLGLKGKSIFSGLSLKKDYTFVKRIMAESPDEVFGKMQGEVWSPRGEAFELIRRLRLVHTSMSVGDIFVDVVSGKAYGIEGFGWKTFDSVNDIGSP